MRCPSPNITSAISKTLTQRNVTFGFIMDGVTDLLDWSTNDEFINLEYFPDPEYEEFENEVQEKKEDLLTIKVNCDSVVIAFILRQCWCLCNWAVSLCTCNL